MVRIPLGTDLSCPPDGESTVEFGMTNAVPEQVGEALTAQTRVGLNALGVVTAYKSQGLSSTELGVVVVANENLYEVTLTPFAAGSPTALNPLVADQGFTYGRAAFTTTSTRGGAVMIKSSREAWVLT